APARAAARAGRLVRRSPALARGACHLARALGERRSERQRKRPARSPRDRRGAVVAGQPYGSGAQRQELRRLGTSPTGARRPPAKERSSGRAKADALIVGDEQRVTVAILGGRAE